MRVTSKLSSYAFACATCVGANLLSWGLGAPSSCFHLAIVISSLYGGQAAGLLSVILSILSFEYFFLPPHYHFAVERAAYPRFAAFITTAVCIHLVIAAKQRADKARAEVEAQHKIAEDLLSKSEGRYRELVELSPDAVYVVDQQGVLVSTNPAGLTLLGCGPDEAIGLQIAKTHVPEDQDAYLQRLKGLSAGENFRFERTFVRMDGTRVPVEVSVSPIRQGFSQGVVRDISERKRNELGLRRSEAYLAEAERMSHIGSWAWVPGTGVPTYWSPEMYRIFERDPLQGPISLEAQRLLYHPEDWVRLVEDLERSIKEKVDFEGEARLLFSNGSIKYIQLFGHPALDASGRVIEVFGITRDVSEQHQARTSLQHAFLELQNSEDQLRTIIDTIPVMAWTTGPDGTSEFMNQRWLDYTGLSVEEYRREGSLTVLHPDDADMVRNAWVAALAAGEGNEVEARMRRLDGEYRWFLIRSCPSCDEQGNVVRWYGTNTDVEDLKAARDSLQKMEKRLARAAQIATLAEVSASIAHEINQPLTAIIANAHMCSDLLSGDQTAILDARDHLQEVLECGHHAVEVVGRMRTLFKDGTFEKSTLDINEVAKEVIGLIRSEASKRRVDLEIDLETKLPPILGDRTQIQQVLVNLCINGLDAMDSVVDRQRKLCVRTRVHDAGAIRVEVQDSGIGLRDPNRVFEAFFTTKHNGMGMGLPICRSIIELHNGRLWPQSNGSPGTTFCFTLPVPDDPAAKPHSGTDQRVSEESRTPSQPTCQ